MATILTSVEGTVVLTGRYSKANTQAGAFEPGLRPGSSRTPEKAEGALELDFAGVMEPLG